MKVLPTKYKGVTYRSRTEARWARFLDELGVEFEYEAESFDLDGSWYLPDFWVLAWNLFIEVKGQIPTPFERERCERLAQHTGKNVLLVTGAPGERHSELFEPARGDEPATVYYAALARCRRCGSPLIEYWSADGCSWGSILLGKHADWDRCGEKLGGDRFSDAVAAARNERFGVHPEAAH